MIQIQKEFFGYGSIQNLKDVLDDYKIKKVFLVIGKKSYKLSGAEEKLKDILKNVDYLIFNDFSPNPTIEDVDLGVSLLKQYNPDMVIAVGGGSVIDIAKAVNALAAHQEKSELYVTGKKELKNKGKPLIAIPTTSGTGSEVTRYATIYFNKIKYSLTSGKIIIPDVAIVDPSLTESMNKYQTASTGLDALCQAIESMWAVMSTKESRETAKKSIKLSIENLENAVKKPDKNSRTNMSKAAYLSGISINISRTTACHSISYPITSYFGVPHGHAVALTMPEMIQYNFNVREKDCNDKRGVHFVKERMNEIIGLLNCKDEVDANRYFSDLMKNIGVETQLSKLNINKKEIETILEKGFTPNRMNNNPRLVTKDALREILEAIL
ncbi:MAG: phosphonoacetaldehyde reductase [Candidatus Heimdallarchaeaceae archaeon]